MWAIEKSNEQGRKRVSPLRFWVGVLVLIPVLFFFIALSIGYYSAYRIVSRSMEPTLKVGDYVLVNSIRRYMPERGDIIAFELPSEPGQPLTKRVIGLAGDTIKIYKGRLYINGHEEKAEFFNQLLKGVNYYSIKLRKNQVFLLGDNRNTSFDSLDFGPIDFKQVYGKVIFRYWPVSRLGIVK